MLSHFPTFDTFPNLNMNSSSSSAIPSRLPPTHTEFLREPSPLLFRVRRTLEISSPVVFISGASESCLNTTRTRTMFLKKWNLKFVKIFISPDPLNRKQSRRINSKQWVYKQHMFQFGFENHIFLNPKPRKSVSMNKITSIQQYNNFSSRPWPYWGCCRGCVSREPRSHQGSSTCSGSNRILRHWLFLKHLVRF